eukprot:m51a1_g823 putative anoctamin-8 (221) ;mRNA; r:706836-707595
MEDYEHEAAKGTADFINEYGEMVLQFGFITMFAAVFPLASFLALVNNLVELRTDAFKFSKLQRRPIYMGANGIGQWFRFLQLLSFLAVINNCLLLGFTYTSLVRIVRSVVGDREPWEIKYIVLWAVVALEHFVFLIKFVIQLAIPDVPGSVRRMIVRKKYLGKLKLDHEEHVQKEQRRSTKAEDLRQRSLAVHSELVQEVESHRSGAVATRPAQSSKNNV